MKLVDKKVENTKAGRGETKGMVRTPKTRTDVPKREEAEWAVALSEENGCELSRMSERNRSTVRKPDERPASHTRQLLRRHIVAESRARGGGTRLWQPGPGGLGGRGGRGGRLQATPAQQPRKPRDAKQMQQPRNYFSRRA